MQDLVGVGVADPGQDVRIGQRALERAVLELHPVAKRLERGVLHLEAARVVLGQRRFAAHEVQARALVRARLGEDQRAARKVERGEAPLARRARPALTPAEAPRDHQVEDQEQIALEREYDPLAEPAEAEHALSLGRGERRIDAAQERRTHDAHALERLAHAPRREAFDVDGDVGELRHREIMSHSSDLCSTSPPQGCCAALRLA